MQVVFCSTLLSAFQTTETWFPELEEKGLKELSSMDLRITAFFGARIQCKRKIPPHGYCILLLQSYKCNAPKKERIDMLTAFNLQSYN
jgi:hypothetical protein